MENHCQSNLLISGVEVFCQRHKDHTKKVAGDKGDNGHIATIDLGGRFLAISWEVYDAKSN